MLSYTTVIYVVFLERGLHDHNTPHWTPFLLLLAFIKPLSNVGSKKRTGVFRRHGNGEYSNIQYNTPITKNHPH